MANPTLDKLERDFPKRHALRAEEVAEVLGKTPTKGVVQEIRRRMQIGRYPGAKKIDGTWQLPLSDLAKILSPPAATERPGTPRPPTPAPAGTVSRRRSILGPTLEFIRAAHFWGRVFQALGYQAEADDLLGEAETKRKAASEAYQVAKAQRQRAELQAVLAAISDDKPDTPKGLPSLGTKKSRPPQ